ncbi:hypothetical protein BsIDN1_63850 [Bacillus safensis]|uniref:Uncharacterized protein n=1 Tax=Bacillus safensis TaxID=561879 RepID=A0A5S9MH18_BACIA|nr:hypothetical protein BsIDN1_63850 [Bacillus safensis]
MEKKAVKKKPSDAVKLGIGFITEDRKDEGLMLMMHPSEKTSVCQT